MLHTRDAIIPGRLFLKHTMPMESGTFLGAGELVVYGNLNDIPPVRFDLRSGKLAIYQDDTLLVSIWSDLSTSDGEIV